MDPAELMACAKCIADQTDYLALGALAAAAIGGIIVKATPTKRDDEWYQRAKGWLSGVKGWLARRLL